MKDMEPSEPSRLALPDGSSLAYRSTPGRPPTVLFLGGFTSDMTGTKATALEAHCRTRGLSYVRFDYTGHGASSGVFVEGTIGRWASDAVAVIDRLTRGPVVLVGSSLGGWLMVLAALARPDRVAGLVGIAAAPDFSEDLLWARLDEEARQRVVATGALEIPNPYGPEPTIVTARLFEEARDHLVLRGPIALRCPVRLFHGLADREVPWDRSLRLAKALQGADVTLTLVKDAAHRLSEPADLERLFTAVDELSEAAEATTR
ncbi:MAG: alpha/beta hydrolase [Deltaproteobacteria bacterium]|nr:alpha/beta hydrolase [Deltaproteobacteria bacterium]